MSTASITIVKKNREKINISTLAPADDCDAAYSQLCVAIALNNVQDADVKLAEYYIDGKSRWAWVKTDTGWTAYGPSKKE